MRGEVISVLSLERHWSTNMATMTSKFNFECVIQYYTDQSYQSFSRTLSLRAGQKTISRANNDITGQKNDIAEQKKTLSRDISFLCHPVIAFIKAQVCDKIWCGLRKQS